MLIPNTVPFELFEALSNQLQQALQMIAALTLTDEEVILCKNPKNSNTENALDEDEEEEEEEDEEGGIHLLGWAESMKADLLAPGDYGRNSLIDILTRYQFLANTHAGYIYGAFEGPQITYALANEANLFINMLNEHAAGVGEDIKSSDLKEHIQQKMREEGVSEDRIQYISNIMAVRVTTAAVDRIMSRIDP